jgi:hypothetical protein
MRFPALLATLALLVACGTEPEPPERQRIEAVSVAPFHTQHLLEVKVVDAGSTYMKRLVEHVAIDSQRGIKGETEVWSADGDRRQSDYFLTAPTPDDIERYIADEPSLTVPLSRELAFGRLDDGRWRTYLLVPTVELASANITHTSVDRDPSSNRALVHLDFDAAGTERLHDLTARTIGQKLAILADGHVVAAPVIAGVISGGRAEITFNDQL